MPWPIRCWNCTVRAPSPPIINDNWRDDPAQETAIIATGIPPTNNLEAAIDATLDPGAYTAVVRGKNNTSGVGLIEVYDLSQAVSAKLANISTRAFISTGDNIVIAGFILGNNSGNDRIIVRGIGPSLTPLGSAERADQSNAGIARQQWRAPDGNNDWQDDPAQAAELTAAGLAPTNALESGIAATLPPGLYTALLAGLNNGIGRRPGGSLRPRHSLTCKRNGGAKGIRTPDLLIANETLYQLSYTPQSAGDMLAAPPPLSRHALNFSNHRPRP